MWENAARRLEGSRVVLEPLEPRHEQGLFEAAKDPRIWRYIPFDAGGTYNPSETRDALRSWLEAALAKSLCIRSALSGTVQVNLREHPYF